MPLTGPYPTRELAALACGSSSSSSSSDGSASSATRETVQTSCCPNPLPKKLYLTFTGALAAIGTVEMNWYSGISWATPTFSFCGTTGATISLSCFNGGWEFSLQTTQPDSPCYIYANCDIDAGITCDPVSGTGTGSLTVSDTDTGKCDCSGGAFTVIISE
jgi:hypothetical protein